MHGSGCYFSMRGLVLIQDNYFSGPVYHGCVNMAVIQMVSRNNFQVLEKREDVKHMRRHASLIAQAVKNCLQCRRLEIYPWVRKVSWRREWLPTAVFLPG